MQFIQRRKIKKKIEPTLPTNQKSPKPKKRSSLFLLLFLIVNLFVLAKIYRRFLIVESNVSGATMEQLQDASINTSIIITTNGDRKKLLRILTSIGLLVPKSFKVIVIDLDCTEKNHHMIQQALEKRSIHFHYLRSCQNDNIKDKLNDELNDDYIKWLLFLSEDISISNKAFLQLMIELGESHENTAAVGCKVLNSSKSKVLDAGNIVFNNGVTYSFSHLADNSKLKYPRPVDFVSRSCLLVDRKVFNNYGGFDQRFPTYYQNVDLQMHIQHDLGKEVWFQPNSLARYQEDYDSYDAKHLTLMPGEEKLFYEKWKPYLIADHMPTPFDENSLPENIISNLLARTGDLKARNPDKANILYIDDNFHKVSDSADYRLMLENLSVIAELGYQITLTSSKPFDIKQCPKTCQDQIISLGVELDMTGYISAITSHLYYFEIVVISRPYTFINIYEPLHKLYKDAPFLLVYKCDGFRYRRDKLKFNFGHRRTLDKNGITPEILFIEMELSKGVDAVILGSEDEKKIIAGLEYDAPMYVIGQGTRLNEATNSFDARDGILFIVGSVDGMYYRSDKKEVFLRDIKHFLSDIYALVLKESPTPIPLTIVGDELSKEIYDIVQNSPILSSNVAFVKSKNYDLYAKARVFVAPDFFGSGIKYEITEALTLGTPVVMSKLAAANFGLTNHDQISCIGDDSRTFINCILEVFGNETKWNQFHKNSLIHMNRSYSRSQMMNQWAKMLDDLNKKRIIDAYLWWDLSPDESCVDGEKLYRELYPSALTDVSSSPKMNEEAFEHWKLHGKKEGKFYACEEKFEVTNSGVLTQKFLTPKRPFPEGEKTYFAKYPDVALSVEFGVFDSGFTHWEMMGQSEGKTYGCGWIPNFDCNLVEEWKVETKDRWSTRLTPSHSCSFGEKVYLYLYPDALSDFNSGKVVSAYEHWRLYGQSENRVYFC